MAFVEALHPGRLDSEIFDEAGCGGRRGRRLENVAEWRWKRGAGAGGLGDERVGFCFFWGGRGVSPSPSFFPVRIGHKKRQ